MWGGQEQQEAAAKREYFDEVKRQQKPRKTAWMLLIGLLRWLIANTLVSKQRTYQRKQNQIRYDEVVDVNPPPAPLCAVDGRC